MTLDDDTLCLYRVYLSQTFGRTSLAAACQVEQDGKPRRHSACGIRVPRSLCCFICVLFGDRRTRGMCMIALANPTLASLVCLACPCPCPVASQPFLPWRFPKQSPLPELLSPHLPPSCTSLRPKSLLQSSNVSSVRGRQIPRST